MMVVDEGILFGLGFFETIEIQKRGAIFLEEHIARLHKSCKAFGIQLISKEEILDFIEHCPQPIPYSLRVTVTPQNVLFTPRPHPYYKEGQYTNVSPTSIDIDRLSQSTKGILTQPSYKLTLSKQTRNSKSIMTYHKSIQYYQNIYERQIAQKKGFQEIIFLNEKGYLSEGALSNIFWICDSIIYTPSVGTGILPGIVRNWVLEYCQLHKIPVQKGHFNLSHLQKAEAVFVTNSLMGVQTVTSFNEIHNFDNHEYIELLQAEFQAIRRKKE